MSVATQRNTQLDTERRNDRLSMRAAREAQNSLETTLTNVRGRQDGLDQAEAAARLHADGPNEVAHDRPPHVLVQLLQAFNNPFIYVLMTLSAISFFTDFWLPLQDGEETDLTGVIIVLCMVLVSGLMRFGRNTARARPPRRSRPWCGTPPPCCAATSAGCAASCGKSPWANWWSATSCACPPAT